MPTVSGANAPRRGRTCDGRGPVGQDPGRSCGVGTAWEPYRVMASAPHRVMASAPHRVMASAPHRVTVSAPCAVTA
jgi:hypothetical protein